MSSRVNICGCSARIVVEDELVNVPSVTRSALPGEKLPRPHGKAFYAYQSQRKRTLPEIAERPPEGVCCCFSIRAGCIVIAGIFVVISIATLLVCILLHPAKKDFVDLDEKRIAVAYKVFAILACLKIIFSGLLLMGILRERSDLMRPWLISYFVLCPLEGTTLIAAAFLSCIFYYWAAAGILFFISVIYLGIYGCCLYVVYTYYASMSEITIINY